MFVDVHAIVILTTVVVPVVVIGLSHGWRPRPIRQVLGFVAALVVMGAICLLLLMPGVPIAEWLFPLIGTVLAGLFVKSPRAFQALCWGLLLVAVGLCVNTLALRVHGYTSTPPSLYQSLDRRYLESLAKELRQTYPPDRVLAHAPLKEILPKFGKCDWDRKTIRPLWHTPLTRLYEVTITPGMVWYPGGPISVGSENLQWKPKNSRGNSEAKRPSCRTIAL